MMNVETLAKVAPFWANTSMDIFFDAEASKLFGQVAFTPPANP